MTGGGGVVGRTDPGARSEEEEEAEERRRVVSSKMEPSWALGLCFAFLRGIVYEMGFEDRNKRSVLHAVFNSSQMHGRMGLMRTRMRMRMSGNCSGDPCKVTGRACRLKINQPGCGRVA